MRLAVVGKGGAGKSLVSGGLARLLAARGYRILALDMDTVPGLALSLGVPVSQIGDTGLPDHLAERVPEKGWRLKDGVDIREVVRTHARRGPKNIRFLQLGKLPDAVKPAATVAFRYVLEQYDEKGWHLITDLAAGTRQPFFGWSNFADVILIVVNPSAASLLTARRLAKLAERKPRKGENPSPPFVAFVANKLRNEADLPLIESALQSVPLPLLGKIPYDEALVHAEMAGQVPLVQCPHSPAVRALEQLTGELIRRFLPVESQSEVTLP